MDEAPVVQLCGVGMKIQDAAPHKVLSLVPNGPAARSNQIEVGHFLTAINSQPLASLHPATVGSLVGGLEGTKGATTDQIQ